MKRNKCSLCGGDANLSSIEDSSFELEYSFTTYSDAFGVDSWGYRVSGLCGECARRIRGILKREGVEVED